MVTADNTIKAEGVPLIKIGQNPTFFPRPNGIAMSPRGPHEANISSTSEGEGGGYGDGVTCLFPEEGSVRWSLVPSREVLLTSRGQPRCWGTASGSSSWRVAMGSGVLARTEWLPC